MSLKCGCPVKALLVKWQQEPTSVSPGKDVEAKLLHRLITRITQQEGHGIPKLR